METFFADSSISCSLGVTYFWNGNLDIEAPMSSVQEFFQEQLGKHKKTISLIEQNLVAQDNILHALTDTNAKYARIRKENVDMANK